MPAITREQLLRPAELRKKKVPLPKEYGTDAYVWLQELSAVDVMEMRGRFGKAADMEGLAFQAAILRLSLINEDGSPMFAREKDSGLSPEAFAVQAEAEIKGLLGKVWSTYRVLALAAAELSGILTIVTDEGEEKN